MGAVLLRVRSEMRTRWRAWVALSLLMGVLSGVVFAAVAAARRTDSAYPRLLRWSNVPDVMVPNLGPPFPNIDLAKASALPQVVQAGRWVGLEMIIHNDPKTTYGMRAYQDAPGELGRPKILDGRLPNVNALDEIAVSTFDLKNLNARLGGVVHLEGLPPGGGPSTASGGYDQTQSSVSNLIHFDLRVVGVVLSPTDFPFSGAAGPTDYISPALAQRYLRSVTSFEMATVRLRHGAADQRVYESEIVRQIQDPRQRANYNLILIAPLSKAIERSFHLQALALWILAGVAGLTLLLVLGQLLARNVFIESFEFPTMRALGMTREDLVAVVIARGAIVASLASVVGIVVAYLLSSLAPIGNPRLAEPHPGIAFDATALLVGAAALIAVVIGVSAFAGWRLARATGFGLGTAEIPNARPSVAAGAFARASMPPTAVAGVRLALEPGHGRTALPVRTTLVGVAVGLTALVATFTFASSLHHLLATPALYGVGWDTEVDAPNFGSDDVQKKFMPAVETLPGVGGIAVGAADVDLKISKNKSDVDKAGVVANALVFERVFGAQVVPSAIDGRLPESAGEIALGKKTIENLHARIGDTVYGDIGNGFVVAKLRIVGVAVVPPFSAQGSLGQGSIFNYAEASAVPGAPPPNVMWVRFTSPAARRAGWATIKQRFPEAAVYATPTPNDILDFGRVKALPFVLAGLLGLLSAATLAHAVVTAIRRRRRDLAILKTLGFVRGQVRRAVAWQASALAIVAVVVAVPVGIVIGRALWNLLATQLGIRAVPVTPLPAVLLTVPATLVLAIVLSLLPARAAARTKPALVLRTE